MSAPLPLERWLRVAPVRELQPESPPTVTVVIPCFNYARFLPYAVRSALTQEGVEVDVVIVDDASTDGAGKVARRLAADWPGVTAFEHDSNQGPVATFNDGLEHASGEFLVRLDADDLLTPGSLARATALARAYPSVGLVYGHPVHFVDEPPPPRTRVRSWTLWPGRQWLADRCRDGLNVITSPEVLMRASTVEITGGQRELAHSHDMEMWMRISACSDVGRVDGPDQAWHREHPDSLSARRVDRVKDAYERAAAFETLFVGFAGGLPEAPALHELARRALARDALRKACHLYDRGRATRESIEALTALARELGGKELPEWRGFRRRSELGPRGVTRRPWYTLAALRRRVEYEVRYRRWSRTGAYARRSAPVTSHDISTGASMASAWR